MLSIFLRKVCPESYIDFMVKHYLLGIAARSQFLSISDERWELCTPIQAEMVEFSKDNDLALGVGHLYCI